MWASEDTPVVVVPALDIGDARWSSESSAPHNPMDVERRRGRTASIGSLCSAGEVDRILREHMAEEERERQGVHERGRTVGKKRAVFGAVRRLMSRSSSASKEPSRPGRERATSLDYAHHAAGVSSTPVSYNSEPAPARRLFSARPQQQQQRSSLASTTTTGREGCADSSRPRAERLGREENFHLAMDNKLVHMAFAAFCKKTFSAENIEFVRQVREVDKLSTAEGTTTSELREKLHHVAAEFVRPNSATEVNVDGASREGVLCSIQAALEAAGSGGSHGRGGGGGGESPWAWVLAVEATEALVGLARELHTVIFDGLWPRFLTSEEFTVMMNTEEMRTVGFTDLDGKVIVSALPPQHPGGGAFGSRSSTANKRQLSLRLASSFRAARLVSGGGGGAGKDSSAVPAAEGVGGVENVPPSSKTASPTPIRNLGSMSGLGNGGSSSSGGSGGGSSGRSLDIVEAATAAAAVAATTKAAATPTARPPLGRRNLGRAALGLSSRPPRTVHSNTDSSGGGGGRRQQDRHHVLGGFSARWIAASRARKRDTSCGAASGRSGSGAGCAGSRGGFISSSPASPASPMNIRRGGLRSSPFALAAAERRAFSLR